jgi:hypothetical protein
MAARMRDINLASANVLGLSRAKNAWDGVWALVTFLIGFAALFADQE